MYYDYNKVKHISMVCMFGYTLLIFFVFCLLSTIIQYHLCHMDILYRNYLKNLEYKN